jgi:hypothetical protein
MALVHAFYTDPESIDLVKKFNHRPQEFSFDELLKKIGYKA